MEEETEQVDWTILIDSAKKLATLEVTFKDKETVTYDITK